ncbi:MAG: pyridoxamine 5'-phosphate oxidase family protein [Granulosicoccaceae bacterium]
MKHTITTTGQLEALYGKPSSIALAKEAKHLTDAYRAWLEKAAFFAFASGGVNGLDCSPRGDSQGGAFKILDNKTLAIPDRRGNNRLDTLRNIVTDSNVAILFLIPGITEALRINGQAAITVDPTLLAQFDMLGKPPTSVIKVSIDAVYFQCARAIMRSKLWDVDKQLTRGDVPTAGEMTKSVDPDFDAKEYDSSLRQRQEGSLY